MILIQVQLIYTISSTFSFIVAMILTIVDIIDHDLRIITEDLALKNHNLLLTFFPLEASLPISLDKLFQSAIILSLAN